MRNVTLWKGWQGWVCEIRAGSGMLIAHGFARYDEAPHPNALAVKRALAQLWN
jgi:hypothetical protein